MKYLSFDIEATGLEPNDYIIEFACVPFCSTSKTIRHELSFHHYLKCPSFASLKPTLNPWVIEHNQELIEKAHQQGLSIDNFKSQLANYLESKKVKDFFDNESITLFGKSMAAIDLPFLHRDLGWDFMRTYFVHRQLDLSSVSYALIDMGVIPAECQSGSYLMKYLNMGDVCHTALEDAVNTVKMYFSLIEKVKK